MKILVTGANGFLGKNLIAELNNKGYTNILSFSRDNTLDELDKYTKECEFVFHLAGVNRPKSSVDFMTGNAGLTERLLSLLQKNENDSPVLISSSSQADLENPYGKSKKIAEEHVFSHSKESKSKVMVYRLPNVFGKWSRPNYNSVVSTFCYNIARDEEIQINDVKSSITLCYIDDVINEFINALNGNETQTGSFCEVPISYQITLGDLAEKIYTFKRNRETLIMPSLEHEFDKALYGTYLSYLEQDDFSYVLKKNTDERGWLAEFMKSKSMGQIFISKTKPGITRGNHWHHTKVEKFLVIQGEAAVRFRKIDENEVVEYKVDGEKPEVIDIPVGYTHSIENIGEGELITLFWASEIFNSNKPDTSLLEVK
ncbi:polysaccharide biosynthesis C-terminal domain-containing protein [Sporosarcina sp. CAU 1771]